MTTKRANIGGVDSHKDTIHVAVINGIGHDIEDHEFPTTVSGYRRSPGSSSGVR
jgi:transposase